jgi:hypothetical protein
MESSGEAIWWVTTRAAGNTADGMKVAGPFGMAENDVRLARVSRRIDTKKGSHERGSIPRKPTTRARQHVEDAGAAPVRADLSPAIRYGSRLPVGSALREQLGTGFPRGLEEKPPKRCELQGNGVSRFRLAIDGQFGG